MTNTSDATRNWDDALKKEARGVDDANFGEVQEIGVDYIVTKKGLVSKDKFYLPKNLVEKFDGDKVWFNITEEEGNRYKKE